MIANDKHCTHPVSYNAFEGDIIFVYSCIASKWATLQAATPAASWLNGSTVDLSFSTADDNCRNLPRRCLCVAYLCTIRDEPWTALWAIPLKWNPFLKLVHLRSLCPFSWCIENKIYMSVHRNYIAFVQQHHSITRFPNLFIVFVYYNYVSSCNIRARVSKDLYERVNSFRKC